MAFLVPAIRKDVFQEYITLLSDEIVSLMLEDRRIAAAEKKTNCKVELMRRVLNRTVNGNSWFKYMIIRINGVSKQQIRQCFKMLVYYVPELRTLKSYPKRAPITVTGDEFTPDNARLYISRQRMSRTGKYFAGLDLSSPYEKTEDRPPENTPWKTSKAELLGTFLPPTQNKDHIINFYQNVGTETVPRFKEEHEIRQMMQIFAQVTTENSKRINSRKPVSESIVKFLGKFSPAVNSIAHGGGVERHYQNVAFGLTGTDMREHVQTATTESISLTSTAAGATKNANAAVSNNNKSRHSKGIQAVFVDVEEDLDKVLMKDYGLAIRDNCLVDTNSESIVKQEDMSFRIGHTRNFSF